MKIADSRIKPTFELEAAEHQLGSRPIAGVDEAGRGPWAGPVVAAAVILDPDKIPANIDDSKTLDEDSRAFLYRRIMKVAIVGVGIADVDRIDRENILGATLWAMAEAVSQLGETPKLVLVDGDKTPRIPMSVRAIVKGDSKCLSIAAASIVAKVTRDRLMMDFARAYPGYGFERHKGYGTPEHQAAIAKLGVSALHRRSFRPVQLALGLVDEKASRRRAQLGFGLQVESKI
ncbi:Ribonuclease H [Hyphomicrobium denitrificans ATCC 51888]|jgi:ribonuclease HII|uniref:Ribonuclease HII n=1 Tax=Hyphomicrobium denitrificans (strain ATCC 51888 / DSM 1869 / NCIMB 11706 / TK 0415) TaxID=582899 RepID=D8JUP3_HYPDA|nr:ribonuclease HII [Hyphomicrobium denitrificans]ADJ24673.1 Ribonuclease H [Hyphomicrobium denitrificans ATCC 51888]